jgi:hypothetical protein
MNKIKNFGWTIAGLMVIAVPVLISVIAIRGLAWVGDRIMGWTAAAVGWVIVIDLALLLLAIIRPVRGIAAVGIYLSSQAYLLFTLLLGFLTCWHLGSWVSVLAGLLLGGIGLVPVGMLVAGAHGEWGIVGNLALGFVLWLVATGISGFLGDRSGPRFA